MFSSACSIQQRKTDRSSFSNQTDEYELNMTFSSFSIQNNPSKFGTGDGNKDGGIVLSGLVQARF
jgi:hypothetical protein